jgi:hypothetical protein
VFSKAALLIAVALVLFGYRWGKSKAAPPQSQVVLQPTPPPKAPWLSVRVLLIIVIILLCIAILTSLQR